MNKAVVLAVNLFCLAVLLVALSSCSGVSPITGGNEVPNMFSATIVDDRGVAVANASVRLSSHRLSSSGSCAMNTVTVSSDSLGNVGIKTLVPGRYVLTVNEGNRWYINSSLNITRNVEHQAGNISIREGRPVRGRILTHSTMDKRALNIFIPGLQVFEKTDSLGFYTIENVPHGRLDLVFGYGNIINFFPIEITYNSRDTVFIRDVMYAMEVSRASGTHVVHAISDFTVGFSVLPVVYPANRFPSWYLGRYFGGVNYFIVDPTGLLTNFYGLEADSVIYYEDGLLVHNFDTGNPHQNALSNVLANIYGVYIDDVGGWWYGYNDAASGAMDRASSITPDITGTLPMQAFEQAVVGEEEGAYRGGSLRLDFVLGAGQMRPYAGVGFEVAGPPNNSHDFSNLDTLIFYARGRGTFRVKILSSRWDNRLNDNMGLGENVSLSQHWVRYSIPVVQLTPDIDSQAMDNNIRWNDIRTSVRRIQFEAIGSHGESLELWLDEIYLKGLSISDINFP